MSIADLRKDYHTRICREVIRLRRDGETEYPNFADKGSSSSREIALGVVQRIGCASSCEGANRIRWQEAEPDQ